MLNWLSFTRANRPTNVGFRAGQNVDVLTSIHDPTVNVTVWKRGLRADLDAESSAWAKHKHEIETIIDANHPFSDSLLGDLPAGSALLADVGFLLKVFSGLSKAPRIQLFFGAVHNDQCRKFHQDYVRLRLIHTYVGPGTEWVPDKSVCREALDQDCPSVAEANRRIVPDAKAIQHAQPGEVIVLKGTRYPGNDHGAIHRSPPIAHLGLTRIVLVLTTYDK